MPRTFLAACRARGQNLDRDDAWAEVEWEGEELPCPASARCMALTSSISRSTLQRSRCSKVAAAGLLELWEGGLSPGPRGATPAGALAPPLFLLPDMAASWFLARRWVAWLLLAMGDGFLF